MTWAPSPWLTWTGLSGYPSNDDVEWDLVTDCLPLQPHHLKYAKSRRWFAHQKVKWT
jgi:hypothetical protein